MHVEWKTARLSMSTSQFVTDLETTVTDQNQSPVLVAIFP
jgi:hypothetical protein